jgi:hypothetical protein
VAIALYNFNLIHAMPKSGVHMQSLGRYLNENRDFIVYRNKLASVEIYSRLLEEHLRYHYLQGYSLLNYLFASWRHSFCSELAAKAYEKSGLRLTDNNKKAKRVLPTDIHRHVSVDPDWIDITHEYKQFFLENPHLELLEKSAQVEKFNVQFTQNMGHGQKTLANIVNSIASRRGDKETVMTPPMNYWSNKLADQSKFRFALSYWRRIAKEMTHLLWSNFIKKIK